ncbi:hypothetical protein MMC07_005492 [Pseudocyphellaria aurata]|nr:hypothetical protein [Pseudocyphellaria aurata]
MAQPMNRPTTKPSPLPKSKTCRKSRNPWDRFYLLEGDAASDALEWDPWPVKRFVPTALSKAALDQVKQRNEENVDNLIDRVVILPACSSVAGVHARTSGTELYSIRSPKKMPVRIHLWMTAAGKIMVRKNCSSIPFRILLETFETLTWEGPCKHYRFWRSVTLNPQDLSQLQIPKRLHQTVHDRWRLMNVFRYMDLPAELRDMITYYAVGSWTEPYSKAYQQSRPPDMALLPLVNKQLMREATSIIMSRVTFLFHNHGQLLRFLEQISKPNRYALRSLKLLFDHESLLDFFGAQVFHNSPRPGESSWDYYFADSLFTERLPLTHLSICFPHPKKHLRCKKLRSACQWVVCQWVWAAARRSLRDIPNVTFEGCIKSDQKKEWSDALALERQGILPDPIEIKTWQKDVWELK